MASYFSNILRAYGGSSGSDSPNTDDGGRMPPGGWKNLPGFDDTNSQASVDASNLRNPPPAPSTPAAAPSDPVFGNFQGGQGPAGIGGTGGFGFVNIGNYLNANPNYDPGNKNAPTPQLGGQYGTGNESKYGVDPSTGKPTGLAAYGISGGYTPGMAALDSVWNNAYGRTGDPTPPAPTPGGDGGPVGGGGSESSGPSGGNPGGAGSDPGLNLGRHLFSPDLRTAPPQQNQDTDPRRAGGFSNIYSSLRPRSV